MDILNGQIYKLTTDWMLSSGELAEKIKQVIKEYLKEKGGFNSHSWDKELISALNNAIGARPQSLVLLHFVNFVLLEIENAGSQAIGSSVLLENIAAYEKEWDESEEQLGSNFSYFIDNSIKSVLLHGHSRTIQQMVSRLAESEFKPIIYQTIGFPHMEGKAQAKFFSDHNFEVYFINESTISSFIKDVSVVLSGANAILDNRLIAKAGTLPLALSAKHFQKPFYVLADARKFLMNDGHKSDLINHISSEAEKDANIFWDFSPKGVKPVNYYFDATPTSLVSRFITNKGLFGPLDIDVEFRPGSYSRLLHI